MIVYHSILEWILICHNLLLYTMLYVQRMGRRPDWNYHARRDDRRGLSAGALPVADGYDP